MNILLHSPSQVSVHIKSLRQAQKLTQAQLGARIGVKQARIADIEKNPGAVSLAQLMQLLHALDTRLQLVPPAPLATIATAQESPANW
jgi:HTH-type transcriptional regulator/antitoxin HipB